MAEQRHETCYAPVFDKDGILRCLTRNVKHKGMAHSRIYLIWMEDNWLFWLLADHIHVKSGHLALNPFWLKLTTAFGGPRVRKLATNVTKQCPLGSRWHSKMLTQLMGPSPDLELESIKPCNKIAMDLKVKMGATKMKAYILVTVCLQTKIVTLEAT